MKIEMTRQLPSSRTHATPLLFVHGAWHGAWCWEEHFLPYFRDQGYASWALCLRGHGKSEGGERLRWTRIADYVADVADVVSRLDSPPVLIGHSMGGLVVQRYLETHQAPGAVLMASVPVSGALALTLRTAWHHPLRFLRANLTLSLLPLVDTPQMVSEFFFSEAMPAEKLRVFAGKLQDESYMAYLDMVFSRPRPAEIRAPMLVLGGEADRLFTAKEMSATAKAYGTEAVMIPGLAHDMMLDVRWESAADCICGWLRQRGI